MRKIVLGFWPLIGILAAVGTYGARIHGNPNAYLQNEGQGNSVLGHDYKMVCYYGSWAVYRPDAGKYPVENIDPNLCTHLIYGFAGLSHDNKIRPLDPWNDLEDNYGKGAFKRFNNLKKINPNLKTIIAIGGWNEGSIKYSNMAANPSDRKTFVESVVLFLEKYDFDGLDLDWEYPAARGGKPQDKENFVSLLAELKEAFAPKGYLLTAATSAGKWFADPAYDIPKISQYLDLINVMCYDYHGGWEDKTGHNAPMYARPDEIAQDKISNVNFSINYWMSRGAPKEKIVMGMGTYGRSFTLQRAENNGLGAPAPQKGQAGPYTREAGSLGYNEICEQQMREKWTVVRDPYHLAPYAYRDRQWVGYDDIESISIKAQYIKAMGLAGGMIWSIETDDFHGKCHGYKYPLLNAIHKVFRDREIPVLPTPAPPPASTEAPDQSESSSASSSTQSWQSSSKASSETWNWRPSSTTQETWQWRPSSTASPSSSSSSTTTTTQAPSWTEGSTGSGGNSNKNKCKEDGMYRDPNNCQKFYRCVYSGRRDEYIVYDYTCPPNTVFDNQSKLCLWAHQVPECDNSRTNPNGPRDPESPSTPAESVTSSTPSTPAESATSSKPSTPAEATTSSKPSTPAESATSPPQSPGDMGPKSSSIMTRVPFNWPSSPSYPGLPDYPNLPPWPVMPPGFPEIPPARPGGVNPGMVPNGVNPTVPESGNGGRIPPAIPAAPAGPVTPVTQKPSTAAPPRGRRGGEREGEEDRSGHGGEREFDP